MKNEKTRINCENAKMECRIRGKYSTLKKDELLKASDSQLNHMEHLSKWSISKRCLPKLPNICETRGNEFYSHSSSRLTFKAPFGRNNLFLPFMRSERSKSPIKKELKTSTNGTKSYKVLAKRDTYPNNIVQPYFYEKGSLILDFCNLDETSENKSFKFVCLNSFGEKIQKLEFVIGNNKSVKSNITQDITQGLEKIIVQLYAVKSVKGEENQDKVIGTYEIPMQEKTEVVEDSKQYQEIFKAEVCHEDVKYELKALLV